MSTAGTLIWNTTLVLIGAAVGASWADIVHVMDLYANVVYVALVLVVDAAAALYIRRRRKA
ncbi:hypothetical protein IDH44_16090 [Paenibacillus sp. IB182496]|uniref:Uncharacterized protein n=1 Tax=Paenibacillus sabuli TaxID=2772509 RepID=A0A927BTW0_9BACL|nr:hypothetical protein [Paenibacillus sabuli]MBD2846717.1 hypothetical protein [Paenibacillus sabuli]